ncbi:MAG: LLM class flavin-dependent oxidoreductase [Candidatus Dadabacteria bacterium]|nr:LLM class flavin-dependent oxidoreductase [Candidatus Dadabacteria bacterium]MYA47727.1 LLM class flavin-dependent oxidoreductase [Candidatus Dadabacteria bacterium]MYG83207.1 LLM class flavin-dependent oxidoreductase [Candidatus Dadabacteria bacterium]MYK50105.1 LLM class flavin-dependent oxidoreductase [Candidatus Dadabacteria bacterium]
MGKIATTSPVWGCSVSDLRVLAGITEEAGFDGIFSPEVPPYNAITNAQVFAECTEKINVGTWIANIYMRQPVVATATALTIQEITGGRMILGLGVSHKPVNNRYDIDMGNPIEAMRSYVGEVRAFADGTSPRLSLKRQVPDLPVHIAGLTKAAAELAGEVADGIMPYLCPPAYIATLKEHVAAGAAKAERDPSAISITNGIPSFVSDDGDSAVAAAKRGLGPYARFPFYQRLIRNIGFGDIIDQVQDGANPAEVFTDELIDSVALAGTPDNCKKKLEEHFAAGVDLAILVPGPVGKQSNIEVMEITAKAYS